MDWEIEKAYSFDAGKEEGKLEGKLEGIQEKAIEDAIQFLKEGDSPEKVSRCIGLPLEQVLELQKSSKTK